jgi:hypothetical protein
MYDLPVKRKQNKPPKFKAEKRVNYGKMRMEWVVILNNMVEKVSLRR